MASNYGNGIRGLLLTAVALGGLGGWFMHKPSEPLIEETQRVLLVQEDVLHCAYELQQIEEDAARGSYDKTTMFKLRAMDKRLGKHQHELHCTPAIHENIKSVNEWWELVEAKEVDAAAAGRDDDKPTMTGFKAVLKSTMSTLAGVCIP